MNVNFADAVTYFLAMLLSLTVHEASHAFAAKLKGDDTAEREGRLTLNPLPHLDPMGTIFLPLLGAIMQFPVVGWAKPVPVDPRNFKGSQKWGNIIVAAAGPTSNLVFCIICLLILGIYEIYGTAAIPEGSFLFPLFKLVGAMVWVNAFLAFFNLIPLPPLDGGTVIGAILPEKWAEAYHSSVAPYGFIILLIMMVTGSLGWIGTFARVFVGISQNIISAII